MIARILSLIAGATGFGALGSGIVATGGLIAFVGTIWLGFALHYEHKGAAKIIETSKVEGANINAKNAAVIARAQRPGAADRVRQNYCRDC